MEMQRRGNGLGGCLIGLGFGMLFGLFVGVSATLGLIGLDSQYLFERIGGGAPELIAATAVPTPMSAIAGAAPGRRLLWTAPIPLDSDTSEPELLVISRNYDRNSDSVVRFSPDQQQVLWESAPIDENGSSWLVTFDDERVFIATETRLLALSRTDGTPIWEAQLSDSIQDSICRDCLQVFDGFVVAYSQNGVLQVFAAADGTALWDRRMREASRQLVRFDGMIGVPDSLPDQPGAGALYLFRLEDGSPAGEIAPLCISPDTGWEDRPSYFDQIISGSDGALYWYLDSARCLVRLAGGEREAKPWAVIPEDYYLDDETFLFGAGDFFVGGDTYIFAVRADGAADILLSNEDYELRPIAATDDVLLVEAQRSRGSSRTELWIVDPADGSIRSTSILQAGTRAYGPHSTGDWASAIVAGGVALIEVREEEEQMVYRLLDPNTGADLVNVPLAVESPDTLLRGTVWTREMFFVSADELYAIAINDGTIRYRWP